MKDHIEKYDFSSAISPIEEIVEDARNGKMYILVDAEDRENEGDLIIPAQFATPAQVNFMAKHGRGLICLSITRDRAKLLALDMMARENRESMKTAFTVSIDAREGTTTGISPAGVSTDSRLTSAWRIASSASRFQFSGLKMSP